MAICHIACRTRATVSVVFAYSDHTLGKNQRDDLEKEIS
jgi:hypothetical protein